MKRIDAILPIVAAILAAGCVVGVPVQASEGDSQVRALEADANVLYRQKVMATIGALMKGLGCVLKKECALDDKAVAQSAGGILFMTELSDTAFKAQTESATVKQTTRPEVWSEWNKFKGGLEAMSSAATAVASAATLNNKINIDSSIRELSKTCKSCHDIFRTK